MKSVLNYNWKFNEKHCCSTNDAAKAISQMICNAYMYNIVYPMNETHKRKDKKIVDA